MTNDPHDRSSMRLQRYLARAGVASRRRSEDLIKEGRVSVNGMVVTSLGTKVDPFGDEVAFDGRVLELPHERCVLLLNKPAGYVTTMHDDQGRLCVAQLVPAEEIPGLFAVGRLDRDTTGLLLFTNDGQLGHALLHPSKHVWKRYVAHVDGAVSDEDLAALRHGIALDDGMTAPARCALLGQGEGESVVEISIHEGRKRQVKRMMEVLGHPVRSLHREAFGTLEVGSLPSGQWRELTEEEIAALVDQRFTG